ncbi:uncharacterized protein LOC121265168 [Juglans microcarpa x Juglans regia]|uniref:uncharacterized protein LOC121265168 n=1 Tax=Juglans microcarpa x Juglans regia TaxID=2249226 RepID=UPI001B7E0FBF|nr:uncharacterized protein LOC121265168 [Juglans microcarpa x Juglans regia]
MGTALTKSSSGNEEKKSKEIGPILEDFYDNHIANPSKGWTFAEFYRVVCDTVEEINKQLGYTQILVPKADKLQDAYRKYHRGEEKLTKDEFQKIFEEVLVSGTGVTGIGIKDSLYIFGVPLTALVAKQRVLPRAIPNEIFIPVITSVTVLIMAKFNKL